LNLATYEWIEGEPISTITADHVASALAFIEKLHSIRTHTDFALFPPASAAILSYADLETQLRSRLEILAPYCQKYPLLKAFVDGQLTPLVDRVTERLRADGSGGSRYNKKLSKLQQTLSPSDFGFHNVIRSAERGLVFVDFEYFGWDDPAKLIVDFALHAGMNLSPELQRAWVDGALAIYGADVRDRLMAIWPAIGLCWCLILLNEYRTDVWLRRARDRVDIREQRDLILQHQLQCSMDLLNDIKEGRFAQLFGKNIVQ
jgi:thiamine kinase-like enzyme